MPSFTQLFTLAACALISLSVGVNAQCDGAQLIKSVPVNANGATITVNTFSCAPPKLDNRGAIRRDEVDNVCGELCTNSCNDDAGSLPPVTADCDTIRNSVAILESQLNPTYTVSPKSAQSLSFQTCTFNHANLGNNVQQGCWSSLASVASDAGAACFPPVQPFTSEGICTNSASAWAISAAHSNSTT
ncbi:hypothetical protein K439DRAFT_1385036 [Ramaria rubella]|nr:hypothetical protein K439DRAFT_1385036 [Ramaria rubella]